MKKLIRILVAASMLAAVAFVAPSPASADHDEGDNPVDNNWPAPALGAGVAGDGDGGWHEEKPDITEGLIYSPGSKCAVTGSVTINPLYTPGGPQHANVIPNVNDDPAHSHYTFEEGTILACVGTNFGSPVGAETLDVVAVGGNDGHIVDAYDPSAIGGANGDPVELDPFDDASPGDADNGGTNDDHDYNDHHGSVNESAWSHSSKYSGEGGPGGANVNKGDIDATGTLVGSQGTGYVKYVRVGLVVFAWGVFDDAASTPNLADKKWNATLLFTPTGVNPGDPFLLNGVACIEG